MAAQRLRRPVKLRLDRDDDLLVTGKRHCFHYEYEVGFDDDGVIRAAKVEMTARAGFSADLSGPVCTRAVCHFDNAYYLPDVDILALAGKTNTQSNTAFRGFGGPQGAIAIEYIIDNIARELGRDPLDVRKANFYGTTERNVTPYGMTVEDNVIHELVAELEASSDYRQRRDEIRAFNAASPVLKKGIALTPVKFGISFNVVHYNQAGALVHVYTDGSVLVSHGGTEMGQGLNTKVAQVVAHELGIGLAHVRSTAADTSKVANTSATAASTGSDLNGKAAQDAARQIRARLAQFAAERYGGRAGGRDVRRRHGDRQRHGDRRSRSSCGRRTGRACSCGPTASTRRPSCTGIARTMSGRPFFYFAYGAAVSEVIVDTLTGEWKLLRADLLHDAGDSINPAIDIGQVEGAFIQGMGWLTTEELWWNEDGVLMTHAPSTYKIPGGQRLPGRFPHEALQEQQRRGHDPALEGDRRAAAAAAVLGVLRDPRRDRERRRLPRPSAARRAGDRRGDPEGGRRGARRQRSGRKARWSPMSDWIRALAAAALRGARRGARQRRRGEGLGAARAGHADGRDRRRDRRHDRRRPPRTQGDRDRARPARRARAARAPPLSAGREPRPVLRRRGAAAVRAGPRRRRMARGRRGAADGGRRMRARRHRCAATRPPGGWSSPRPRRSARWARARCDDEAAALARALLAGTARPRLATLGSGTRARGVHRRPARARFLRRAVRRRARRSRGGARARRHRLPHPVDRHARRRLSRDDARQRRLRGHRHAGGGSCGGARRARIFS